MQETWLWSLSLECTGMISCEWDWGRLNVIQKRWVCIARNMRSQSPGLTYCDKLSWALCQHVGAQPGWRRWWRYGYPSSLISTHLIWIWCILVVVSFVDLIIRTDTSNIPVVLEFVNDIQKSDMSQYYEQPNWLHSNPSRCGGYWRTCIRLKIDKRWKWMDRGILRFIQPGIWWLLWHSVYMFTVKLRVRLGWCADIRADMCAELIHQGRIRVATQTTPSVAVIILRDIYVAEW